MSERKDIYQQITNRIIQQLENGVRPWLRPWETNGLPVRPTRSTGEPYRGINVLVLWDAASQAGYSSPYWFTFKQALALNACVKKGERGTFVVYAGSMEKTEQSETGEDIERRIPFLKSYAVFNAEQIEGLDAKYYPVAPEPKATGERLAQVDRFVENTGVDLRHGGNRAFYNGGLDFVQMPNFEQFSTPEGYAATLCHEVVHWSGHEARLNRTFGKRFGDQAYAREELVAEIGSAFLGVDLGVSIEPREDHAAYLESWLKCLKEDKRAIFQAASAAERAAGFLHDLQP
ncbi:ArdC family protein [Tianweitania populi]|uniref:Antirestriction protein n=1 Tax=Tianweitania populi TaxID=1607949 RepID=A0A8J3GMV4_9HYPH|nr:zincin-like metallopeptidase domain-containing protein [Tianweitania populi]GHD21274.1 antirestriction protein [Tianweitania populi]